MSQAQRCTILEVHALNYWRARGVMIKAGEPIPLSPRTPPSFATRRPKLDAFACLCILLVAALAGCSWLAYGAGIWK